MDPYFEKNSYYLKNISKPVTKVPLPQWIVFWVFIYSCSIWFFTIFLTGSEITGSVSNYLIYVFIMGLGITAITEIVRTYTRKKSFKLKWEFLVWICVSAFSFWLSRIVVTSVLNIQNGILYFLSMGCGVYLLSFVVSHIFVYKTYPRQLPHKIFPKSNIKYGKNIKLEMQVFHSVNAERKKYHLHQLTWDDSLYSNAQMRVKEITRNFSHFNVPQGCGENIAKIPIGKVRELGFVSRRNVARSFMKTWMNSSGHRENILRSGYRSICVGITAHGNYYYGVQLFR